MDAILHCHYVITQVVTCLFVIFQLKNRTTIIDKAGIITFLNLTQTTDLLDGK